MPSYFCNFCQRQLKNSREYRNHLTEYEHQEKVNERFATLEKQVHAHDPVSREVPWNGRYYGSGDPSIQHLESRMSRLSNSYRGLENLSQNTSARIESLERRHVAVLDSRWSTHLEPAVESILSHLKGLEASMEARCKGLESSISELSNSLDSQTKTMKPTSSTDPVEAYDHRAYTSSSGYSGRWLSSSSRA